MTNNLIGISGRKGLGKDTVGSILQYLNCSPPSVDEINHMMKFITDDRYKSNLDIASNYQIKKFADKTTKAFELITGVNYHKLSREDKEIVRHKYIDFAESQKRIFNEDIWVNALFTDYKPFIKDYPQLIKSNGKNLIEGNQYKMGKPVLPNWIITDVRFPNEAQAIKDRGGIVIRVNRGKNKHFISEGTKPKGLVKVIRRLDNSEEIEWTCFWDNGWYDHSGVRIPNVLKWEDKVVEHPSETSLDDYEFDYVIENNSDIPSLIEKIKALNIV